MVNNSAINLCKLTQNNPNLDFVYFKQYAQFCEFQQLDFKILSRNKILTQIKGQKFFFYYHLRKSTHNDPNSDLVIINAYANY